MERKKEIIIEKRTVFWKPKHYRVEKVAKDIVIMHPTEQPDLETMLHQFMRKKKKWE